MYSLILSAFVIYEKLLVWYVFYHTGSLTNSDIYYFFINLLYQNAHDIPRVLPDLSQVIRCCLIYVIIQPVAVKVIAMGSPL